MAVPMQSLVMQPRSATFDVDSRDGIKHECAIWFPSSTTRETAVVSDSYDISISLLMLDGPTWDADEDELLGPLTGIPGI